MTKLKGTGKAAHWAIVNGTQIHISGTIDQNSAGREALVELVRVAKSLPVSKKKAPKID